MIIQLTKAYACNIRMRRWVAVRKRLAISAVTLLRLRGLYAISRLDHVCFERYGSGSAVEFEEETAGVTEHRAGLISPPQWRCRGAAVLTYRLKENSISNVFSSELSIVVSIADKSKLDIIFMKTLGTFVKTYRTILLSPSCRCRSVLRLVHAVGC